jgi:hypothetical protein
MNPYSSIQDAQRRAQEPHPVEEGYSALVQEYNTYTKSNTSGATVQQWGARLGQASNNESYPEMADIWASIKQSQGEQLNRSTIESYAQQKTGSVLDWNMARSFLPQYDDLGAFNIIGQDTGLDAGKLAQRIEDSDMKESGLGASSGINAIVGRPNGTPTDTSTGAPTTATTCLPGCDFPALSPSSSTGAGSDAGSDTTGTQHNLTNNDHRNDKDAAAGNSGDAGNNGNGSNNQEADCATNYHTVKAGDTVWSIAAGMLSLPNDRKHARQIAQLAQQIEQLNPKLNPNRMIPNRTRIELPDLSSIGASNDGALNNVD